MTLSRERSTTFDWELQEVQWATGYTCYATGVGRLVHLAKRTEKSYENKDCLDSA